MMSHRSFEDVIPRGLPPLGGLDTLGEMYVNDEIIVDYIESGVAKSGEGQNDEEQNCGRIQFGSRTHASVHGHQQ